MAKQKNNDTKALMGAIIFAALVIGGSLIFFGMQQKAAPVTAISDDAIAAGIERYVQLQQEEQANAKAAAESASLENFVGPKDSEHRKGNADAAYTIVEYSDFECPFCKSFHNSMIEVMEKRDDVNWIFRHFPLGFHDPIATEQALIAECVGNLGGGDQFWEFTDELFVRTKSNKGISRDAVIALAEEVVGASGELESCIANKDTQDKVDTDKTEGAAAGVSGTPTSFIVNNATGKVVKIPGGVPAGQIEALILEASAQ